MPLKLNTTCFGAKVRITISGEVGTVTGFSSHMRNRGKQFYVEYRAADGRAVADWFFDDQLTEIA